MINDVYSPDLVVSNFVVASSVNTEDALSVSLETLNQGDGTAGSYSNTRVYLSQDGVVDGGDRLLRTCWTPDLPSGGSYACTFTWTVPWDQTPGTYYVIAVSDATGLVSESDEGNNLALGTVVIGDPHAPTTTASLSCTAGQAGWCVSDAQVTLSADDGQCGSGVVSTEYNLDGAGWTTYGGTIAVGAEAVHTLTFRSTDAAGNVEAGQTLTVKIDKTAPVITISSPMEGAQYANGASVLAEWTADDAVSGIATAVGTLDSGQPLDTITVGPAVFTVTATDMAGNSASLETTYSVLEPITIPGGPLPGGKAGEAYDATVTPSGGTGLYDYAIVSGALPDGLFLSGNQSPSVSITGTPTTAGTFSFTLEVSDAAGSAAAAAFTIVVDPALQNTIVITKAEYNRKKKDFKVEATSDYGPDAALELEGFGPMTWKADKARWEFKRKPMDEHDVPVTVTVTGPEGSAAKKVKIK